MQSTLRQRLLASTLLIGTVGFATPAWSQTTEDNSQEATVQTAAPVGVAPSAGDASDDQSIIVTGSRIARPNLEGASPVTVLNSQEVKLQGTTRAEDLVNSLPQAFAGQGGNIANGASGTATLNLRGLGSERTLVLVNGRRLLPGDPFSSAADINTIPSALIERVDVLTGGASSVYGSDAISGVVNFVMNTDFEGIQVDGQYSLYNHSNSARGSIIDALNARGFPFPGGGSTDGGTYDVNVTMGTGFADGRGHITAYAGYRKLNAVLQGNRDYSACNVSASTEEAIAGGAGLFTCAGSATSDVGTFFTNDATLQIGPNRTFIPGATLFNFAPYNHFQRPDERYTFGAFANYEINDSIQPYLEVMFMDDRTEAQIAPSGDFGNTLNINCDNPLLSAQQRAIVCAPTNLTGFAPPVVDDPTTPVDETFAGSPATVFFDTNGNPYNRGNLQILRRNVEGGGRIDTLQHTSYRIVGGVRGDLSPAWSYDAFYQFGQVNFAETYLNDFSVTRLTRALDVVDNPNTPGVDPVCRSVLDGSDPNCVPYDIFAAGGVTGAATSYLGTPGFQRGINQEKVINASITGDLGQYGMQSPWANSGVGINVGAEYRKEFVRLSTDLAFQTGDLAGQGAPTLPIEGSFNVKEAFGEIRIPIVEEGFIHELSVNGGYRYSKYEVPGTATSARNSFSTDTYKVEVEFAPIRDVRFRASYNRAVRAPNIQDLFATQRVALNGSSDPCAGDLDPTTDIAAPDATAAQCALTGVTAAQYGNILPNPAEQYNGLIGGDTTLTPEVATSKTLGVVLTPTFLRGFSATVDYFDIKVKNTITQIGQDTIIATCVDTANPEFCGLIHRDQFGSLWRTSNGFIQDLTTNIGALSTKGIDVGASYNRSIGSMGSIGLSMVGTWLDELITDDGVSVPYDCAGFYGIQCGTPNPEWRHKARLTWTGPSGIGLSAQWRYFSGVDQDLTSDNPTLAGNANRPANLRIPSQSYFDLSATFDIADHYTFRLGAQNILDKDPPIIGSQAQTPVFSSGNTYPQVYDALGRYIYAGVTLNF